MRQAKPSQSSVLAEPSKFMNLGLGRFFMGKRLQRGEKTIPKTLLRQVPGKSLLTISRNRNKTARHAYLSCLSNTSLTPHLSRFRRMSNVFKVTFCSPNSIRCSEDLETPSLRANAGRLKCPRRFLRKRPSCVCKDAAISASVPRPISHMWEIS